MVVGSGVQERGCMPDPTTEMNDGGVGISSFVLLLVVGDRDQARTISWTEQARRHEALSWRGWGSQLDGGELRGVVVRRVGVCWRVRVLGEVLFVDQIYGAYLVFFSLPVLTSTSVSLSTFPLRHPPL